MNDHVSGIQVPQVWLDEIAAVDQQDRKKKAAEMMGRFLRQIKTMVQGVHLMPLGWTDMVPDILAHADIEGNKAA
jgi:5,10-methylenetetrahydrofolate reductase